MTPPSKDTRAAGAAPEPGSVRTTAPDAARETVREPPSVAAVVAAVAAAVPVQKGQKAPNPVQRTRTDAGPESPSRVLALSPGTVSAGGGPDDPSQPSQPNRPKQPRQQDPQDQPNPASLGERPVQTAQSRPPTPAARTPQAVFMPPPQVDEYRIVRALGRGGMGQVFLGHDTVLDRPVAVKFHVADRPTPEARERFLVEARAIARLQHPNVVAVYRVGETPVRAGESHGHPYLVAEFVRGESLDRLPKPLPWRSVLRMGIDLARGLAAVHRQGVLHRDVKPANAIQTEDGTVKLLDFGLAKFTDLLALSASDDSLNVTMPKLTTPPTPTVSQALASTQSGSDVGEGRSDGGAAEAGENPPSPDRAEPARLRYLTAAGAIVGTPAYLAPEIWRGAPATERSDVYMLGALLYELCCGHPPHNHSTVRAVRKAAIHEPAPPLLSVSEGVPPKLAAIIHRCLHRNPADRTPSALALQEALEALHDETVALPPRALLQKALKRGWPVVLTTALLSILLPGVAIFYLMRAAGGHHASEPTAVMPQTRPALALLGLAGAALPDTRAAASPLSRFSNAFTELLGAELAAGEKLRVLPAERVARMKIELGLADAPEYSVEALGRIRQHLGADLIATGSYRLAEGPRMRLSVDLRVQDAQTGRAVAIAAVVGNPVELFELVARAGSSLREQLGVGPLAPSEVSGLRAGRPSVPEVAQLYAEGLAQLRRFDPVAARRTLERAVAADPDFPLSHLGLSEAWHLLGDDNKARSEARRAFDLSGQLRREERYLIEARLRQATKEWDKALGLYRALLGFFPDNVDYGIALAEAQLLATRTDDALTTVQRLRRLPPPASQDARIDLIEAKAAMDRAQFDAALGSLQRAAMHGEAIGAPLLVASALQLEAFARANLGEYEPAQRSAERARGIYAQAGDRMGMVQAMMAMGSALEASEDYESALRVEEDTLQILLDAEYDTLTAVHVGNMAYLLGKQGKLVEARLRAESGLALSRQTGNQEAHGLSLVMLGWLSQLRGDLPGALRWMQKAQAVFTEMGDPRMQAWALWHRGQILAAQDLLDDAERLHREALHLREEHHLGSFAAESQVALAELALERGRDAEAEQLAQRAAEQFHSDHTSASEAWARAVVALALSRRKQTDAARASLAHALALCAELRDLPARMHALALLAEAAASVGPGPEPGSGANSGTSGGTSDLRDRVEAGVATAHTAGLVGHELALQLALGRLRFAETGAPGLDLTELAERAKRSGLALLARRAAALAPELKNKQGVSRAPAPAVSRKTSAP